MKNPALIRRLPLALLLAATLAAPVARAEEAVFAKVGDTVIGRAEYEAAVATAARAKFYHGKAPEAEVLKLRREVGNRLVDDALLAREAQRRGLAADQPLVQKTLDELDARYRGSAEWQKQRDRVLPGLKRKLESDDLLAQLGKTVRDVPEPAAQEVEAYYRAHPDKFTEPEQVRLSLILLKMDPSSPTAKWDAAKAEAAGIVRRLRGGADFAELARLHSGDPSAAKGGDMGYVHRGMLPDAAQEALDKLAPRKVSDPVVLLEGVAILRLDDRRTAKLNELARVRDRARDLLKRERSEAAWSDLVAKLRREARPAIDESVYAALGAAPTGSAVR